MLSYNISINEDLAKLVDKKVKDGKFANRSEFFRQLLRATFLENQNDWTEQAPYKEELVRRVKKLNSGKEKLTSLKGFEKEFKL